MRRVPCPALGRDVELPDRVERIVSLSPSLTDTVIRLGLGSRLVGRSAWCWRPSWVEGLPVAGSYTGIREELLEGLRPDLVLSTSGVQADLARRLAGRGVPLYQVPLPATPWGILEQLAVVAVVCGEPPAAREPLSRIAALLQRLAGVLPPLVTYAEIDLGEPVTAGAGSYLHWALEWLGLRPVGGDEPRAWWTPEASWLNGLRPDLVLYDPQPRKRTDREDVRALLEDRGLGHWFSAGAALVVTGGDVLAHHGPWLLETGLPSLVDAVRAAVD